MTQYNIGAYVEGLKKIYNQGLYEVSSVKKERLGTLRVLDDGRAFVYAKAGANISAGLFCAAAITTPVHEDTVTVAHPAGTKRVVVTASGVTANQFEDGYLIVTEGTGAGEMYKIKANTATGGAGTGKIYVYLYEGLATAWDTSDTDVDLYPNPYNGVIPNPTDAQQLPVGVAVRSVSSGYYFWLQVAGFAPVKIDTAGGAAGQELDEKLVIPSTNHAGQGRIIASPTLGNGDYGNAYPVLGWVVKEADVADDTVTLVKLTLW